MIKEKSLSALITELDGHFSKFIRTRDTVNGKVICFTCGKRMAYSESQCGHFIDRDQMPTRFDERNCHAVCEDCNCFDADHHGKYSQAMIKRYGVEEVQSLCRKARGLQKFFKFEILDLIEFYRSENRVKSH
jgi:hypothetical protein